MNEFFTFLKSPDEEKIANTSLRKKVEIIFFSFMISFAVVVTVSFLLGLINLWFGNETVPISNRSNKQNRLVMSNIVLTLCIGPLMEELAFRLSMRRSRITLAISLTILFYFVISLLFRTKFYDFNSEIFLYKIILCCFIFFAFLFYQKLHVYLQKIPFSYYFYFSCFFFAMLHSVNFLPLGIHKIGFLPLLLLPQFVYGIILGYTRLKAGFIPALFVHMLINALILTLVSFKS